MRETPTVASDNEEPTDAALRVGLGLRPRFYELGEDTIDPRPCPLWCHYDHQKWKHEVHPERPFDAFHTVGTGADVALSRYPGEWNAKTEHCEGYVDVATLHLTVGQYGQEQPYIQMNSRLNREKSARSELELSVVDAKDLVTALTYFIEVLEGRRLPIEGSQ